MKKFTSILVAALFCGSMTAFAQDDDIKVSPAFNDDQYVYLGADADAGRNLYVWDNTFNFLTSSGTNSFGVPGGYLSLQVGNAGWSGLGYNIVSISLIKLVKEIDANDKDMQTLTGEDIKKPDTGGDTGGDTPATPGENESFDKEVVVSDDAFKWDDNNKYYAIFLDGKTQKAHISDDRYVNIGDNGTSQNSYLWEDSFVYGEASGKNSFGEEGEYKAIVTSDKGWSGMGYNINGEKGDLDLSGINQDYKLHLALKATHNYPIDFYITDGSGHQAHLIFGQYDMDGKDPVANFKRDGKWHNVDIPMSYLTQKFGINFSKDTDYDGNLLCINAGSKQGVQVDYDAVFFYGPKDKTTGIEQVTVLSQNGLNPNIPTEIFDIQGRKVQSMAAPGIYIIRSAAGVRKVLKK